MNRVNLVLLWHMHQPQYRDPATGLYVLPWTRLHALKDYWGMVRTLSEFPNFHATINMVPALVAQLEEYASGNFSEPWFDLAFRPAEDLNPGTKKALLDRAFQINHEHLMSRWPRYTEIFQRVRSAEKDMNPATLLSLRDWRDLQLLSQLAWMDEFWLASDETLIALEKKGANYTEEDKQALKQKQLALLREVLPEYRRAAESGQVEISTTPFYHPILPLLCDTDIARVSNPYAPQLQPQFKHPEDALEQLRRARAYHAKLFGREPAGLWPSEGSVSDEALDIAMGQDFQWFATDEGVLGRTLGVGFGRDGAGIPENADRLYSPLKVRRNGKEIVGFFRDHMLSDLVGFVYSRMGAMAAAEDLHQRIRAIGERVNTGRPLTVSIILDGENAWEYFPGSGRDFLRHFYGSIQNDPDVRAMTVSEALAAAGEIPAVESIVPGSWINANFDIWIGHREDLAAWRMLSKARDVYGDCLARRERNVEDAPDARQLSAAYEALLAAEGSDWCWWYGPEHSTSNDSEFDAFYRTLLTEVYLRLGLEPPPELAEPIKALPEQALKVAPQAPLDVKVDGHESSYFEWLGAGLYSADRRGGSMHGRASLLHELHYGFSDDWLYVRVDLIPEAQANLREGVIRVSVRAAQEVRVILPIREGKLGELQVEVNEACLLGARQYVRAAYGQILELAIAKTLIETAGHNSLRLGTSLWEGGLPVDMLPADGFLDVQLGADAFAWEKS